jgi:hypothetical protein
MFEVHSREIPDTNDDGGDDRELCVQMAFKMAACLPNDPAQAKMILGLTERLYAVVTESRQDRERLAG